MNVRPSIPQDERWVPLAKRNDVEILEEYPMDKYLPSYLVYSQYQGDRFHVLFAVDAKEGNVRIITAYRPSPHEGEADLKTRRRPS